MRCSPEYREERKLRKKHGNGKKERERERMVYEYLEEKDEEGSIRQEEELEKFGKKRRERIGAEDEEV